MITLPELAVLSHKRGDENPRMWRSIEEFAETPEFEEYIRREYPSQSSLLIDPISRRNFLKLMAASLALSGVGFASGCAYKPKEEIVPSVISLRTESPGKPKFFATAMTIGGSATGLLVRSDDGRPTKVEGNPKHPASLGATDVFAEASVLGLYDPDRSQTILHNGKISSWGSFLTQFRPALEIQKENKGSGLRILTETIVSPTIGDQLKKILAEYPEAKWHQYERVPSDNKLAGAKLAFGKYVNTIYKFDKADRIFSLDADFLDSGAGKLRYIRDFSSRRKSESMNRFYMIESTPTLTGAQADHILRALPTHIQAISKLFANGFGIKTESEETIPEKEKEWIEVATKDILNHQGSCIIIVGNEQPIWMHQLGHLLNDKLGNIGKTVFYTEPVEVNPMIQSDSLLGLTSAISSGSVEMLLILGGNPVYTTPVDSGFADLLSEVKFSLHLSLYEDETSQECSWHIPQTHFMEEWSDTRTSGGTASIVQPLIAPLYGGKSPHDILALLSDDQGKSGYEIVRDYWKSKSATTDFEVFWQKSLREGVIESTTFPYIQLQNPNSSLVIQDYKPRANGYEILFRIDASVFDGRFANNGWLQELPRPLTKITWDNAAIISPNTAKQLGIETHFGSHGGDYITEKIEIELNGRKINAPIWILPGQPDNCITLPLGYGRRSSGRTGNGIGFDAGKIIPTAWNTTDAHVKKISGEYPLAVTQHHHTMEGKDILRSQPKDAVIENNHKQNPSIYPAVTYEGYAWGMSIDLNSCIGCNACITSCQAENNIPIVGKEQVAKSREMHWLRVDRYYTDSPENPAETAFQPVPCMHCENAPCEVVCPVEATVHSAEGLNDMVYNRCVGTRYCSNNCPYKVRRFNFLLYQDWTTPALELLRNPEVSVRSRGVMEKCTYCVQRIQHAKITSEEEGRSVRDGEIKTACQSACPAEAIIFGNINDPESRVSKLKSEERNYSLLEDLNTKPRTTYLSRLGNPNPMIK